MRVFADRNKKRAAAAFGAVFLGAALFAAAFPAKVLADQETDTFVTGTRINGIGVGGLTEEEAKERIEGFYAGEYTLSIRKKGGGTDSIRGTDIGYKVTVPQGLAQILADQNATGRMSGPSADNSHTMAMTASYSQEKLQTAIQGLPCISGSGITVTSDAHISAYEEGKPFTIVPAVQGNNVDVEKTTALIVQAVDAGETSLDLEAAGCYYTVNVRETSPELEALCRGMNQLKEREIRYIFGEEREILSGEVMSSWIAGSEGGTVSLDQEKLAAYAADLAARHDTAGTVRTFTTVSGEQKELTGPYGWKIDPAGEMAALTQNIQDAVFGGGGDSGSGSQGAGQAENTSGQAESAAAQTETETPSWKENVLEKEPAYALRAAARDVDWGTTYAEVDLAGQHVYMIQEGALVWDAPCVTGNLAKGYDTPAGIYSLTYKQRDKVLRGAKRADGSYEYESPVDYWMPFNGGIGFHDANWRGEFGGSIYKTNGSHGCVNLPPSKAAALYELVYKGMPVICY